LLQENQWSNRNKHLSDIFESRQVFSTENANLAIEQPFDNVIDDDDVNMESLITQPNLIGLVNCLVSLGRC